MEAACPKPTGCRATPYFAQMTLADFACWCTGLVLEQAGNVARQATTQEGRAGSRISAQEAVTGSYDAIEKKWKETWQQLPPQYVPVFLGACIFVALLLTGLLLALWRFVLFGLH